jgi:DNA repair protein RadD
MLRKYQQESVDAVYAHLRTREDNPCIVLPTGTGKSHVIAQIVSDAVLRWRGRVLVLAHVKELLQQNADKIMIHAPGVSVGIYSAGLKSRDTKDPVIVAGIQSVYKRAGELGPFNLIIIDEAHLIPPDGDGMYRQFLTDAKLVNPGVRLIGLTATPYRLKGGQICAPENLLNHVCYEAGLKEMIAQGFLSSLRSKAGKKSKPDLSGVHILGGEFVASEMAQAFDQDNLVRTACQEIVEMSAERKSVLVFAASVAHAEHVQKWLSTFAGEEVGLVTGETPPDERAELVARFKGDTIKSDLLGETKGPIKYLVNVRVFTTGFDAPNVDTLVMLFSTASIGLYVQVVGRGTRLCPGKEYCLVLDYGGNVMRHGPVDAVKAPGARKGNGDCDMVAPAKECPACGSLIHAAYSVCPDCGAELPTPPATHGFTADGAPILSGQVTDETYCVANVFYSQHTKKGADESTPKTLRVDYQIGGNFVSEWVCPEHTGWARAKFEAWWRDRSHIPPPTSAMECADYANDGAVAAPEKITVRSVAGERFDRVIDYVLKDKPDYFPKPGWNDDDGEPKKEDGGIMQFGVDDDEDIPF